MNTHRQGWEDCLEEVKLIMLEELRVSPCTEMDQLFTALVRRQHSREIRSKNRL